MTGLSDFKRFVKTQESHSKQPLGSPLPPCRGCRLGVMKKLHAKSKADFVAEADGKARLWWIQSGNSEAAKVNSDWFEAAKKRAAAGGGAFRCANRRPWLWCSRRRCLLLLRRPARETSQSDENAYYNTENREKEHVDLLLLA